MASTVVAVGAVGFTAALALGLAAVGGAAGESQRVAGVADAVALAAADTAAGFASGAPCTRASDVANAAGVDVVSCVVDDLTATVEIVGSFARIPVSARARAGPPP